MRNRLTLPLFAQFLAALGGPSIAHSDLPIVASSPSIPGPPRKPSRKVRRGSGRPLERKPGRKAQGGRFGRRVRRRAKGKHFQWRA